MLDAFKAFVEACQKNTSSDSSSKEKNPRYHQYHDQSPAASQDNDATTSRMSDDQDISPEVETFTMEMYTSKSRKYSKAKKQFRVSHTYLACMEGRSYLYTAKNIGACIGLLPESG